MAKKTFDLRTIKSEKMKLAGVTTCTKNGKCIKDIFSEYNRETFPDHVAAQERATVCSAFSTNDELTTHFDLQIKLNFHP